MRRDDLRPERVSKLYWPDCLRNDCDCAFIGARRDLFFIFDALQDEIHPVIELSTIMISDCVGLNLLLL